MKPKYIRKLITLILMVAVILAGSIANLMGVPSVNDPQPAASAEVSRTYADDLSAVETLLVQTES